jgi:small subunit ribosomal protein S6
MTQTRKYEGLFIFPPDESGTTLKDGEKRLEEALQHCGGKVLDRKDGGRRSLGFPLRKLREGHFILWNFEMDPLRVAEFRKSLQLDENILKSTLTRAVDVKEAPPSAPRKPRAPRPAERESRERIHGRQSE